ncbi:MAG: hypothetical protein U1F56_06255 [Rubrivivax sp.]
MTVYELGDGAAPAEPQRTRRGRVVMLLVLAACAAPVIASYLAFFVVRPELRSNYGALIQPTRTLPDLMARSLDGREVPLRSLKGQWLLVVTGPSACDADCETRLHMQRQLREMIGRDRDRVDKVWLVSDGAELRPALRDAVLARPEVTVLRVDGAALARWLQPEAGHQLDEHLYLVDPMGEWMMRFPVGAEPRKVLRDIERLLRASASWDRAGR